MKIYKVSYVLYGIKVERVLTQFDNPLEVIKYMYANYGTKGSLTIKKIQ